MTPDREKVIKEKLDEMVELTRGLSYAGFMTAVENANDILALLKEQQEQIDKLIEESASNAEMAEGLKELLKEQEVKTGKWIEQTDYMGDTYYDCSVCDESWTTIEGTPWVNGMNYCPHCGAKMEFEGR